MNWETECNLHAYNPTSFMSHPLYSVTAWAAPDGIVRNLLLLNVIIEANRLGDRLVCLAKILVDFFCLLCGRRVGIGLESLADRLLPVWRHFGLRLEEVTQEIQIFSD